MRVISLAVVATLFALAYLRLDAPRPEWVIVTHALVFMLGTARGIDLATDHQHKENPLTSVRKTLATVIFTVVTIIAYPLARLAQWLDPDAISINRTKVQRDETLYFPTDHTLYVRERDQTGDELTAIPLLASGVARSSDAHQVLWEGISDATPTTKDARWALANLKGVRA